jgi:hypothetical protein
MHVSECTHAKDATGVKVKHRCKRPCNRLLSGTNIANKSVLGIHCVVVVELRELGIQDESGTDTHCSCSQYACMAEELRKEQCCCC